MSEEHGYVALYRGKRLAVRAPTLWAAQQKAAGLFKARKAYEVIVQLAETADGDPVIHRAVD